MAEELRAAGAVGAVDGSFFQEVPLVGYRKVPGEETVTIRGPEGVIPHELDVDFTWWPANLSETVELDAVPLIFVGHGVVASEHDWDDYKDADVSGKVLVFLNDDPQLEEDGVALFKGPMRTYYGRWTYKFEQARDRGALGAIVIHTTPSAGYGWQVIGDKGSRRWRWISRRGSKWERVATFVRSICPSPSTWTRRWTSSGRRRATCSG
jgi:hypothetical protein